MDNAVTIIAFQIELAKKPIALVASASLGVYLAIHVWKVVRKAI